ncbi:class I SAM-dependent methyltransferase [Brevundimonas nasdae]|uniref:class I SAM-dependent methyltransferase n=1 Tax=Brevundimonas nasdae TaxID=172043 RepID=UPI0028A1E4B1|nr:class I SAM-dependent methyltransferase [Brevundimonas nasdae]
MSVHDSATKGYAVGAETYVRGRPGYPPEASEWLRDVVGLAPGRRVLDVGSGTGKFLPLLRASGADLIALEPVAAMRRQLSQANPDVEVLAGSADSIPLPDASVDAVVCAQAFHWFATKEALAEMRRVLKPGGVLGLIWNVRDETVPWVAALSDVTDALNADTPRYRTGEWRRVFPTEGLRELGERHAVNSHVGPADQVVVARTLSVSFIAALPQDQQQKAEQQVRDLIACTPELQTPEVAFPYRTVMIALAKT